MGAFLLISMGAGPGPLSISFVSVRVCVFKEKPRKTDILSVPNLSPCVGGKEKARETDSY